MRLTASPRLPFRFLFLCTVCIATLLTACSRQPIAQERTPAPTRTLTAGNDDAPVKVRIIAFNDLHGNLEPPHLAVTTTDSDQRTVAVPAGGVAYLADAIRRLKQENPNHAVVSAGDMIGASPLLSALFLDEATIDAINAIGIDFNAVGNHEFDKGSAELLRMQNGGCERFTPRTPCALDGRFAGANFAFLAANTLHRNGDTLFPSTGIKSFGNGTRAVKVGFIGMTLKGTAGLVAPAGIKDIRFADEAATANALVPQLKAQGADAIVVLIHQGGTTDGGINACPNLSGDILPILDKLDPAIDVVVSGHTHRAYICDYPRPDPKADVKSRSQSQQPSFQPLLLTSAGRYGTLLTDIELRIDPHAHKVVARSARNLIVQGEGFTDSGGRTVAPVDTLPRFNKDAAVDAVVSRYAAASASLAQRPAGILTASLSYRQVASGESPLGNLIADAQLAATAAPEHGGAQLALMNPGGLRAEIAAPPGGGGVRYEQLFRTQPFGNTLIVRRFTGAQLRAILEQQFSSGSNTTERPRVLFPSHGFSYAYDLRRPPGRRIVDMRLHGRPIRDDAHYRVTMNSYLAGGGDNFSVFRRGEWIAGGLTDVDALESYLRTQSPVSPPSTDRIQRLDR